MGLLSSPSMTNVFLDAERLVTEHGSGVSQLCLHSWVFIFPFGIKKGGLRKDHIRLPRGLIKNESGGVILV